MSKQRAAVLYTLITTLAWAVLAVSSDTAFGDSRAACQIAAAEFHAPMRGILVKGSCVAVSSVSSDTTGPSLAPLPTRVVDCGVVVAGHDDRWNVALCGRHYQTCTGLAHTPEDAFATQTQNVTAKEWITTAIWCPNAATPTPDPDTLRQQALRLLPALPLTISPPDNGLVNLENILSNPTTMTRQLAPATVLGQKVHLRLHFDHATWTYGDDSDSETTRDPGEPYDQINHPCPTLQCPDYQGHTYRTPGTYTLSTTITWTVDYTLDNKTWTALGPLDGPTTKHTTHIRSAHTHLVP